MALGSWEGFEKGARRTAMGLQYVQLADRGKEVSGRLDTVETRSVLVSWSVRNRIRSSVFFGFVEV